MYSNPTYKKASDHYLRDEINDATPEKLIIKVYDFAIINSKKGNLEKTNKAISVLITSLNFHDESVMSLSADLMKLYQFCQDQARKDNFELVSKILTELRETWLQVFNTAKPQ